METVTNMIKAALRAPSTRARRSSCNSTGSCTSIMSLESTMSEDSISSAGKLGLKRTNSASSTSLISTHSAGCIQLLSTKNGVYEGEFDAKRNFSGYGILRHADFMYAGEWLCNKPHGYGVFFHTKMHKTYEGQWEAGKASGCGRLVNYKTDLANSADQYIYGKFQDGEYVRRSSIRARSDRAKSVEAVSNARRAAALAAASASNTMKTMLRQAAQHVVRHSQATSSSPVSCTAAARHNSMPAVAQRRNSFETGYLRQPLC